MERIFARILQEIMKKNNIWNIRRLVDNSFVPSSKQPSVLYYKLTDFRLLGESLPHHKDFSWLMSSAETANDADDS